MMKIKITETKTVEATPELIAKLSWELNNDEQAEFFDHLAIVAGKDLSNQMESVADGARNLTNRALHAMEIIGYEAVIRLVKPT